MSATRKLENYLTCDEKEAKSKFALASMDVVDRIIKDTQDDPADGQAFLHEDPHQVPSGKTAGIGQVVHGVAEVLHDLADRNQPDQYLKKSEDGCEEFHPPRDIDDADRPQRYIDDPRQGDQQGDDNPCK